MPIYYDKTDKKFRNFPEDQIPGGSTRYQSLDSNALTRYNNAISQGLQPTENWVFNAVWEYDSILIERARGSKLEALEQNYSTKVLAGYTHNSKVFSYDEITREIIAIVTDTIQVENALKDANPGYTRQLTSLKVHTVDGELVEVATLAQWDSFFVGYSKSFYELFQTYQTKKWYLVNESDIDNVNNYDITL